MRINVRNDRQNPKLEEYLRRRLQLVIGQFAERIAHVDVHFYDENDGKGGIDKVCTVEMKLVPRGHVHVRAKNDNIYNAALNAVHRAERVVAKAVDRGHRGRDIRHQQGGIRNVTTRTAEQGDLESFAADD